MLSLLLRLLTAKDVIRTVADAARIATSAREIVAETRQAATPRDSDRKAVDRLFVDLARLEGVVVEQARVLERTAGQLERLAIDVRRAALLGVLGLGAGIVALVLAIAALIRG